MKKAKLIFGIIALLGALVYAAAPTVTINKVQQRYPWNGMVDIDYEITGDATGCKLEIGVEDKESGNKYVPTKFLSVLPVTAGKHRVTWSTEAEGITIVSTNVSVSVALVNTDPEVVNNNLYYVIDLSGGTTATSYPVTTLDAPPGGVWSDEYKTTKLVLRRIEAGSYAMNGSYNVALTQPFYIGVFEVTQKQYELVTGNNPSYYNGDARPVERVSWNTIRGNSDTHNWPNVKTVDANSFIGLIRSKTGLPIDLPTEAQWEYACRAGTTSSYNNGGSTEADLKTLGRYSGNCNDGRGGYSQHTTVGSYAPNAWGLYDMHGNVWEWCLDWYGSLVAGSDPVGLASGSYRVLRGGGYDGDAGFCTSSYRYGYNPSDYYSRYNRGFRLACSAGL